MRQTLAGCAVAGAVGAGVAVGQIWSARWTRVLVPDQDYTAGNDTWPFQLVLFAWCAASATVLGVAAARPVVRNVSWRYVVVLPAGLGAVAPHGPATGWVSDAVGLSGDTVAVATAAVLLGALVGAVVSAAVLAWRAVLLGSLVWVGWVSLNVVVEVVRYQPHRPGRSYVVPVDPLGMVTPTWFSHTDAVTMAAVLSALLPAALVGWWATRRADRAPLLGVMVGPLLLVAVHLAVRQLPGARSDGDHYSLMSDTSVWILVAVLGSGVGAWASSVASRRPAAGARRPVEAGDGGDARPAGAGGRPSTAAVLLTVAATLLSTAALFSMWSIGGGWLAAGAAALGFGAAWAHRRGRTLSPAAGAGCAVAGLVALAVAGRIVHDSNATLFGPWHIASSAVIVTSIGWLVRGTVGAAWSVAAVGGVYAATPVAAGLVTGSSRTDGGLVLIVGPLALLSAVVAVKAARDGRAPAAVPDGSGPARISSPP
jgi:hypothetical protein